MGRTTGTIDRVGRPGATLVAAVLAATVPPRSGHARDALTPPAGNVPYLSAHAVGTQDYVCLPSPTDPTREAWTFLAPQAVLSAPARKSGPDVAEHLLSTVPGTVAGAAPACTEAADGARESCPTWRSPEDQSTVWGAKAAAVAAGSGPDCPNAGSIACLLVRAVANDPGRLPEGLFARTTHVQRLDTGGGSAPTTACTAGQVALVPYTATYTFYRGR